MRRYLSAAFAILAVLALAIAAAGCGGPDPAPGWLEGKVSIGPINPVEQPGVPNTRPYSATLLIKRPGSAAIEIASDDNGEFRVSLPPGTYDLEPVNGDPLPTASAQEFVIESGRATQVRVDYDSGIR